MEWVKNCIAAYQLITFIFLMVFIGRLFAQMDIKAPFKEQQIVNIQPSSYDISE